MGVTLRLKLTRSSQTYLFPFHLSDEILLQPIFYGILPITCRLSICKPIKNKIITNLRYNHTLTLVVHCQETHNGSLPGQKETKGPGETTRGNVCYRIAMVRQLPDTPNEISMICIVG